MGGFNYQTLSKLLSLLNYELLEVGTMFYPLHAQKSALLVGGSQ